MAFGDFSATQAHFCVKGGIEAIEFCRQTLGAEDMFHKLAGSYGHILAVNAVLGG